MVFFKSFIQGKKLVAVLLPPTNVLWISAAGTEFNSHELNCYG